MPQSIGTLEAGRHGDRFGSAGIARRSHGERLGPVRISGTLHSERFGSVRMVTNACRALLAGAAFFIAGSAPAQVRQPTEPVECEREAACLRALKGLAARQGEVLRLKLADGKWKTLGSDKKACQRNDTAHCVIRELRAYRPEQSLFVVEWTTAGDGGSEIVSATTGEVETLDTMPEFSPSGRWFVSVD